MPHPYKNFWQIMKEKKYLNEKFKTIMEIDDASPSQESPQKRTQKNWLKKKISSKENQT